MNVDQLNFLLGGNNNGLKTADMGLRIRLNFLRKVYGILAAQLTLNTIVSGFILFSSGMKSFVINNSWIMYANLAVSIISMIGCMFKRRSYPTNLICLALFTLSNSLAVGVLVSFYDKLVVFQAFLLTAVIVIGLTVYTLTTKTDFSWLGASLSTLLWASLCVGLLQIFVRSPLIETLYTLMGACIFSAYIIYDTQLVMKHLSPEDYIVGVMNLYLDIINLFIKILRLLNDSKKKERRDKRD